jgi:hypothetical protein
LSTTTPTTTVTTTESTTTFIVPLPDNITLSSYSFRPSPTSIFIYSTLVLFLLF